MAGNDSALGSALLKEMVKDATVIDAPKQVNDTTVRVLKTKTGLKVRETTPLAGGEPRLELISGAGTAMRFNDLNDAALDEGKREIHGRRNSDT